MATREYFWGVELSEKKKEVVWDPEKEDEEDDLDTSGLTHFLFLKQAVLGKNAKDGERNLVEITAEDFDGNSISLPLLSLKMGLNESTVLDIGASPPISLKLVSGSGPVCLTGQHALEMTEDDLDLLDDEAEESPVKVPPKSKATKRPSSTTDGPAKKAKLDESDSKVKKDTAEEDDDDYDSEEDEDFTMNMGDEESDEDSSDEDESGDEEDGDNDEDEEDDEKEEEEKESPEKKSKDKGKVNGAGPKKTEQKKTPKGKDKPSVDQLKKLIMQSPSKPKKQGKFVNYVKNAFKVSDEKTLNDLWTWYKESALKG